MSRFIEFYFHFFYAQHVSDINTSIIRSLRLFYCITTLVVFSCFDVCWSFGVAGWSGNRVAGSTEYKNLKNCDVKLVFYSTSEAISGFSTSYILYFLLLLW